MGFSMRRQTLLCIAQAILPSPFGCTALQDSMFDFLRPIRYKLEHRVAAQSIPSVLGVPDRKRLSDFPAPSSDIVDHSAWDACLKAHVTVSQSIGSIDACNTVDYASLAQDKRFQDYLTVLRDAPVATLPPYEQLALWMNAYNALCCNLIVEYERDNAQQGPLLASINELTKIRGGKSVWDQVAGIVGGQQMSLNDIEHKQLRLQWNEPAVHACIVCASASCPNLRPEAFTVSKLRTQMQDQVADWLSNPSKGLLYQPHDKERDRLILSRIFLWFQDDFADAGGVLQWLSDNVPADHTAKTALVGTNKPKIRYFEYSWNVNRSVPK